MPNAIEIEQLSKLYRLGQVGAGSLSQDLSRHWARLQGREDPFAIIGQTNDRTQGGFQGEIVWALNDVNLSVEQGEVFGIIGRNGAGKSTLLKLLSRVTAPSGGIIRTRGRTAALLEVGTGFHPELTGRENIYLNGAILGMRKGEITTRLDEIVHFSGCERYLDTPVKRYSSGMTVRLGFAVAAHLPCEILIVDEVLAVGDAEFQSKCIDRIQGLAQGKGRTVIFVSHNMASIRSLCTRVALIDKGTVCLTGSPDTAINHYLSLNNDKGNKHSVTKDGFEVSSKTGLLYESLCGEDILFKFQLKSPLTIDSLSLGFLLYSNSGNLVGGGSSKMQKQFAASPSMEWEISARIEMPRLTQGNYHLKLYIGDGESDLISIDEAISITIHSNDVFKIGREIPNSWGNSFWSTDWTFDPRH